MNHGDLKHLRDYFHGRLRTPDVEMAGGGLAKKVGPLVKRISRLGGLRNDIEDVAGSEQARRFDQAGDLTNLSRYSNDALRGVFTEPVTANGELPLLMAMPPRDFEKYATPLFDGKYYQGIMPWEHISAGGDLGSYLNYLYAQSISGGLSHVPFLRGTVPGSPDYGGGSALSLSLPEIIGHEGRHRMRALDKAGDAASLVQMRNDVPNDVWLRSQTPDRAVVPQYGFTTPDRDPVSMPEFFAEGGRAKLSKESVDYSPGMGTTRCRNCAHFKKPSGCALVAGKIDPSYWCEKFKRAYAEGGEVEDDYGAGRFTPDPETQRMRRSIRASTNAIRASHPELRDSLPNVSARDMFNFINPDPHLRDQYGPSGAVLDALSIASLGVEGKAAKSAQWAIPAATELGAGLLRDMKPYGYNPLKYGIDKADQLMNWITTAPESRPGYADGGKVLPAATTELRGQNSWVNAGPYAERNRFANQDNTVYADQKTGILPAWTWEDVHKADGGAVRMAGGGDWLVKFTKNLAESFGGEKSEAIAKIARNTARNNNENLIVGRQGEFLSDPVMGNATGVATPEWYEGAVSDSRKPFFTAHTHSNSSLSPSSGDLYVWGNSGRFGPAGDALPWQDMLIHGMPSGTTLQIGTPGVYDSASARDRVRRANYLRNAYEGLRTSGKGISLMKDFQTAHGIDPFSGRGNMYNSIRSEISPLDSYVNDMFAGPMLNDFAKRGIPIDVSAEHNIAGSPYLASDVWPEFTNFLRGSGLRYAGGGSIDDDLLGYHTMTYAKGGPVDDDFLSYQTMFYGKGGYFGR